MHIVRLLTSGAPIAFRHVFLVTCLAGLANAVLLGMVNQAAEQAALSVPQDMESLLLYVLLFVVFFMADRASLREANRLVQHRLEAVRLRVVSKLRRVELRDLENLGHGDVFGIVAQEVNQLSQTLPLLVSAAQSAFLLAFCLLYIATLSLVSFVVVALFTSLALGLFWLRRRQLDQALVQVHAFEADMLESLAHFTKGFQEIRLNADKNDALFSRFTGVVGELQRHVVGVGSRWVMLLQFGNAFLYALVGAVIFVLPMFFEGYTDVIYKITVAAIFCVGPVTAITAAAPLYTRADIGLGHVARLEAQLAGRLAPAPVVERSRFAGFTRLSCRDLTFSYRDPAGEAVFTSGPFSLDLARGEVVFVTGGNGSGKSTAMKLVCGLYAPDSGTITVDGAAIGPDERQDYRELFSAVFAEFHLFDRLHGLDHADTDEIRRLIARVGLADKVSFADGRFSTTHLSTGQRKRLALVVALLEDRDIYLFDEWAADQDAHFRAFFYDELLPELKARGKAVLAVTHDDRFWSCCDRRLSMDLGRLAPAEAGA